MTPSVSPYDVFKAEEWVSAVAQPIGIGQCLRLTQKKSLRLDPLFGKKNGSSLKKAFSIKHLQLAFVRYVDILIIFLT